MEMEGHPSSRGENRPVPAGPPLLVPASPVLTDPLAKSWLLRMYPQEPCILPTYSLSTHCVPGLVQDPGASGELPSSASLAHFPALLLSCYLRPGSQPVLPAGLGLLSPGAPTEETGRCCPWSSSRSLGSRSCTAASQSVRLRGLAASQNRSLYIHTHMHTHTLVHTQTKLMIGS